MITVAIIPYLIVINLLLLFLFTISGLFLLRLAKRLTENPDINVFIGASVGAIIYITTYAIIMSYGRTVFAIMPVCLFYLYKISIPCNNNTINLKEHLKPFISLCIYAIVCFSLNVLTIFDLKTGEIGVFNSYYHFDSVIYGRISKYLTITGSENWLGLPNIFMTIDNLPHHYFETWYDSMVSFLFIVHELISLQLVVFVFFNALVALGIQITAKHFSNTWWLSYIVAPLLIWFLCGVSWTEFLQSIRSFVLTSFSLGKLSLIYWIIMGAFLAIIKEKILLAVAILSMLPLFFISTSIGIGLSISAFFLVNLLIIKKETFSSNLKYIYLLFIVTVWIIIFYVISKSSFTENTSMLAASTDTVFSFKIMINIAGATILQFSYIYIILIFLILINLKYIFNNPLILKLFLLSVLFFVLSLFAWTLFHPLLDSIQLFSNLVIATINIFSVVLVIYLITANTSIKLRYINIALVFLWCLSAYFVLYKDYSRTHSSDFYVSTKFKQEAIKLVNDPKAVGCILPAPKTDKTNTSGLFLETHYAFQERYIVGYLNNNLIMLTHFDDTAAYRNPNIMAGLKYSPFFHYTRKQINEGTFVSMGKTQLDFIQQHNIQFALVEPDNKPYIDTLVLKHVKSKIVDQKSKIELWKF